MHLDVDELRAFYLSPLGRMVRQIVSGHIRRIWPDLTAMRLLGIGHPTPYFRPYLGEAERLIALMPAAQGVLHWPPEGPNRTLLAYDHALPLDDQSVDRVLIVHGLESSNDAAALLREVWRVLVPSGRVLVIAPNRAGLWASSDKTPFGIGRPYSKGQVCRLVQESMFEPLVTEPLLFLPPTTRRFVLGSARSWERIGARVWPRFSGAIAIEAEKQLYQGVLKAKKPRGVKVFVPDLGPARPAGVASARALPRVSAGRQPRRRTRTKTATAVL